MPYSMRPLLLLTFMLLLLLAVASSSSVLSANNNDDVTLAANAIIKWVVAKEGFFSEKLEIHHLDPNDSTSPLGVFASHDITPHEPLLYVPHECFIALWQDEVQEDPNDETELYFYQNVCKLSQKLAKELKLGENSDYAPFVEYMNAQTKGQIPATYSDAGKSVLRKVQTPSGNDLVDWMEHDFNFCTPLDRNALALTKQRGYDTAMIPIWDMFNHKNGHVNTENDPMYANNGLQVRASTDIYKGQEVYATYDECVDCRNVWWYWGTPEIFRDFGFVEQYRQRWVFEEEEIYFEIDENDNQELEVTWDLSDDGWRIPGKYGIAFLRQELERLRTVSELELKEKPKEVPAHEWDTIVQFHQAATTAISKAIESAELYLEKDNEL